MNKRNKKTFLKVVYSLLSVCAWILIWGLLSYVIDLDFIFPGPKKTFAALLSLIPSREFWLTVIYSLLRIILGFVIGVIFGVLLSFISHKSAFLHQFISIGMTVVKSTPVASVIMILWVIIGSQYLPSAIGLLMVTPIIWQNLLDGYNSIDSNLSEVCDVFSFSRLKRFKYLTFPTLLRYFVPAALTSVGLAWKSGIAAEIITYTKNSIGRNIFDAKNFFEGDVMLAWTLVVIAISLVLEKTIKYLIRKFSDYESYN